MTIFSRRPQYRRNPARFPRPPLKPPRPLFSETSNLSVYIDHSSFLSISTTSLHPLVVNYATVFLMNVLVHFKLVFLKKIAAKLFQQQYTFKAGVSSKRTKKCKKQQHTCNLTLLSCIKRAEMTKGAGKAEVNNRKALMIIYGNFQ